MSTNDILDRTASALAATTVFGKPHEHNGITVIPTATIRGGGGGGGGTRQNTDDTDTTDKTDKTDNETGEGGGFGFAARPAGVIIVDGDTVSWKAPPVDLTRIIIAGNLVAVAYFLFTWLTARANN
ncbi:MAG: spore germination protein GerW family protein [Acidimicrobiales bacterium]